MTNAVVGSLLGLFVSGNTFSFIAFVGMTSLFGIVVNNCWLEIVDIDAKPAIYSRHGSERRFI